MSLGVYPRFCDTRAFPLYMGRFSQPWPGLLWSSRDGLSSSGGRDICTAPTSMVRLGLMLSEQHRATPYHRLFWSNRQRGSKPQFNKNIDLSIHGGPFLAQFNIHAQCKRDTCPGSRFRNLYAWARYPRSNANVSASSWFFVVPRVFFLVLFMFSTATNQGCLQPYQGL